MLASSESVSLREQEKCEKHWACSYETGELESVGLESVTLESACLEGREKYGKWKYFTKQEARSLAARIELPARLFPPPAVLSLSLSLSLYVSVSIPTSGKLACNSAASTAEKEEQEAAEAGTLFAGYQIQHEHPSASECFG